MKAIKKKSQKGASFRCTNLSRSDLQGIQFGTKPGFVFSAPGRTEIGGDHTDHQHGCVLAGARECSDTVAAVARSERGAIRVLSEGYPLCEVSLSELEAVAAEAGSGEGPGVRRSTAARFAALGHAHRGL